QTAGFWRRLAALIYDSFVLFALLILATTIALIFTKGHAIKPHNPVYTIYLLCIWFAFFGWFWVHAGQTLGMLAWSLRIEDEQRQPITWQQALIRFIVAFP